MADPSAASDDSSDTPPPAFGVPGASSSSGRRMPPSSVPVSAPEAVAAALDREKVKEERGAMVRRRRRAGKPKPKVGRLIVPEQESNFHEYLTVKGNTFSFQDGSFVVDEFGFTFVPFQGVEPVSMRTPISGASGDGNTPVPTTVNMDCDGVGAKDIFPFTPLPEVPGKNPSARRALYNVADELGSGAFGHVYKVRRRLYDRETGEENGSEVVALKVIPAAVANDPVGERERASLHSELGVLFSARCDYVVALRGAFCFQGQIAIALECCDSSLSQIIKAKYQSTGVGLDEGPLARVLISVLRALDVLNSKKIIHSDIKPSNILVNRTGEVRTTDFGVSRYCQASLIYSGGRTVNYCAPERYSVDSQAAVWKRNSDIWSLGVTGVQAAHGVHPYPPPPRNANTSAELHYYHQIGDPALTPTLADDDDRFSQGFIDWVDLMLIRDRTHRPYANDLLAEDYAIAALDRDVDMAAWATALIDLNHDANAGANNEYDPNDVTLAGSPTAATSGGLRFDPHATDSTGGAATDEATLLANTADDDDMGTYRELAHPVDGGEVVEASVSSDGTADGEPNYGAFGG